MPLQRQTLRQRNVDLYTSAIRCVVEGETHQLHRFGLDHRHVPQLLHLSFSEVFDLADHDLDLSAYLYLLTGKSADRKLCMALIGQAAPRDLIVQVFGMSSRRYAAERVRLGLAETSGRPNTRALDPATEHRIWRLWVLLADPKDATRLREADHWLLVALEIPKQLRSAWSLIQRWARNADARKALMGDRLRLSSGQQQAEQELRERHRLALESVLGLADKEPPRTMSH